MDYQALGNMVTTLGFPIVVCFISFYYINKQTESHKEEVDGLKEEINSLCIKLQSLTDKIEELVRGYDNENK